MCDFVTFGVVYTAVMFLTF